MTLFTVIPFLYFLFLVQFAKDNGQEVNINELIEKDKEINKLEKQIELEKENIEKE